MQILNLAYFSGSSIGIPLDKNNSSTSSLGPGSSVNTSFDGNRTGPTLVNSTLAFIKPYRLKGDTFGLKQAVLSSFHAICLSDAYKSLWDACGDDLRDCGLTVHSRRSSEKLQLVDALLTDIIAAFDKLDTVDSFLGFFVKPMS